MQVENSLNSEHSLFNPFFFLFFSLNNIAFGEKYL